jgi:AcrR family transcriptional regulator/DNA-binding MarR family transcriptional regulator
MASHDAHLIAVALRTGRKRLARRHVTDIQRGRIVAAAVETVEELGYARMTVAQVICRARVSRKTFYELFSDREDCFLAAFDDAVAQATLIASVAFEDESRWQDRIRSALAALLRFLDEEPGIARLCVVEALAARERVQSRRRDVLEELAGVIDRGRPRATSGGEPAQLVAEGVVGAVLAVLHTRLLASDREPLTHLLGSLMSIIVLPYLGARAARSELTMPAPEVRLDTASSTRARSRDPLEGLAMRLTHRTVRVLIFIAAHPGASNREIAEGAGIVDPGQASKLLSKLARLGLAENLTAGRHNGIANAWHLTARGADLERACRPLT